MRKVETWMWCHQRSNSRPRAPKAAHQPTVPSMFLHWCWSCCVFLLLQGYLVHSSIIPYHRTCWAASCWRKLSAAVAQLRAAVYVFVPSCTSIIQAGGSSSDLRNGKQTWVPLLCAIADFSWRHYWFPAKWRQRNERRNFMLMWMIWVVLLIGWGKFPSRHDQSEAD